MLFKNQEKQEKLLKNRRKKKNQKVHVEKKCGNKKFITTEFYLLKVKFKNQDYFNENILKTQFKTCKITRKIK